MPRSEERGSDSRELSRVSPLKQLSTILSSQSRGYARGSSAYDSDDAPAPALLRNPEEVRAEFSRNPEMRVPCLLLLDNSGSMSGKPIKELNDGLQELKRCLSEDDLAASRAEPAIITFGGSICVVQDFTTVHHLKIPLLSAAGDTPMGSGIIRGVEMVGERMKTYRKNAINSHRPWIFLLTDGAPTDQELWQHAVDLVRTGEKNREFEFFAVGVGDEADLGLLSQLTSRPPQRLKGLQFREMFGWIGSSLKQYSRSKPGEVVHLERPDFFQINP